MCSSLVYNETIFLGNVFLNSCFKCHSCGLVVCFGGFLVWFFFICFPFFLWFSLIE